MFTGRAATPPPEARSVADYGNSFNPDGKKTNARPTEAARDALLGITPAVEVRSPQPREWLMQE